VITYAKHGATLVIFAHPFARSAGLFTAKNNDGSEYRALAILTYARTRPQEPELQPFVEKLSRAAKEYLADSDDATAFVLMNRPRDWRAHSSSAEGARRRPGKRQKES
jgi:hypothetical protein